MSEPGRYTALRHGLKLREEDARGLLPPEIELQAMWFSGLFGRAFQTVDGRALTIVDFGRWNREAGPDFHEATIQVEGRGLLKGAIELDAIDRDWERHGHGANPSYEAVVLHLFLSTGKERFFTRTVTHREVAQVHLQLPKDSELPLAPMPLAHAGRCSAPLREMPSERIEALLASAAEHRLSRKARRLERMIAARGQNEALYQLTAEALGYKENKIPMLLIAQRCPLAELQELGKAGEGILFGLAGFLEKREIAAVSGELLDEVRRHWEIWWRRRASLTHLILKREHWKAAGRPLNHPHRRLGALFLLAEQWPSYREHLEGHPMLEMNRWMRTLEHPFWTWRYTLHSSRSTRPLALIGLERVRDLFANVAMPLRLHNGARGWDKIGPMPGAAINRRLRTAAIRLFGTDENAAPWLRRLDHQQGLLQIYDDFCMADASNCEHCPFPELVGRW